MKILKRLLTGIVLLALAACGVVFALSNPTPMAVDFLAVQLTTSTANWIIASFVLGGLSGLLAGLGLMLRLKATQLSSTRKIKQFEQELSKAQLSS